MIGHIVLLVGYIAQLWFIGKSFAFERDAASKELAKRFKRWRITATIGIPLPMVAAFFIWWLEYERAMAVLLVTMEAIPLILVLGFVLKMIYSVNAD